MGCLRDVEGMLKECLDSGVSWEVSGGDVFGYVWGYLGDVSEVPGGVLGGGLGVSGVCLRMPGGSNILNMINRNSWSSLFLSVRQIRLQTFLHFPSLLYLDFFQEELFIRSVFR